MSAVTGSIEVGLPKRSVERSAVGPMTGPWGAMAFLVRLANRYQPKLLWISLGVTIAGALPDALFALWLGILANAFRSAGQPDRTKLIVAICGVGFSAVVGWLLRSGGVQRCNAR